MKIKQKKIEEEGDADDQCSADMLLRGYFTVYDF